MDTALPELNDFVTRRETTLAWRREQLELLRKALLDEKGAILTALASDLCVDPDQALVFQVGSMFAEIDGCLENLEFWSKPQKAPTPLVLQPASSEVHLQPKGVVLILGAWNYPFNVTVGPVTSALAAGNCVVVKPSELAPESAKVMLRIFDRLDRRGVRCFLGGPEVSAGLTRMPFDHIVYTGGERVAKLVMAAAASNLTPVTLELGGKSPVIISKGVNLAEACRRICTHKFTNAGQTCISPDYILVERDIRDEVAALLEKNVKGMFEKPESAKHLGRLVNKASAERILDGLRENHGGKVLVGGPAFSTNGVHEGARYVPPTVVLDPSKDSKLLQMELFGPVLPVVTIDSCEDAIKYINSKPKPLALYIFTPSSMAKHIIESTSSGGVVVGDCIVHKGNADLPFGGIGNSGMGRMHGFYGFRELSNERAIMKRPLFVPSPITLPLDPKLAKGVWLYATSRPGVVLKRHLWKVLAAWLRYLPLGA